ncbi:MAG: penicillin-binding protein activator [Deltaproteobacteria bacterium]|nr:penicillin-binding protein activator [Deltaproteobacteria bacterium]MBI3387561.1 penicillin-binding protein activator [Deltaproteobacteria bacterium]
MRPLLAALPALALLAACTQPASHLPPAPSYTFRQAEDAFARGDYVVAVANYRRFLDATPEEAYVPRAYYQLALAQHHLHQQDASLATLDELKQRYPTRHWVQVDALRGDDELAEDKRVQALIAWEQAWQQASPAEQSRLRSRIESVAKQLTDDERTEANQVVLTAAVREMTGLSDMMAAAPMPESGEIELSKSAEIEADIAQPAPLPEGEAVAVSAAPEAAEAAATEESEPPPPVGSETIAALPVPEVASTTRVACLLPLTGPDHAYGKRALAGLRLAFADAPQHLVIRDTGGDPANSAALVRALDKDPTVLAVIGPLRSSESEVAAPVAEREHFPMLLLSQSEGLAGGSVFQVAMTRNQQVVLLVGYAVDTLKIERAGIVYPNDGYGTAFAEAFEAAFTARGGHVVGTETYQPGDTDFSTITAVVRDWSGAGLQAVFIPDAARMAVAVAAHVRSEAPDVTLLGTESWNDPAALADAGAAINGAIFADSFFANSTRPSTREFVEHFERGAGRAPTVFEAQAFDAGLAVRRVFENGATSREQVTAQLTSLSNFEGAGVLRSTEGGFQRDLSVLRYRDGQIEEVAPAVN